MDESHARSATHYNSLDVPYFMQDTEWRKLQDRGIELSYEGRLAL